MPATKEKKVKSKSREEFDTTTYLYWIKSMLLMRRFEEMAGRLYGQQKIRGFCHLYIGQEACISGAVSALREGDKYITSYRDHAHPLALGTNPDKIMAELYGKVTGISKGKGGSMHMFDKEKHFYGGHGIVGNQIPMGAGIAFSEKYNNTGNVCLTYLGDGALRIGAFHEAVNISMFLKLPVIFIIENNGYAMGTSVDRTSNVTELYKTGLSYDIPSEPVDAMNVIKVHRSVAKAAFRARNGEGPSLLEFRTYRYKGHSMSDPAKYRSKEELQSYKEKDPIEQVKKMILSKKILKLDELDAIDKNIKDQVKKSVEFSENSDYPSPEEAYNDIYVQKDYPFLRE
ncbi:MAG: pyruvate dehydrogenase (acetyl-transferring) E1 component subunit alpha [Cytophagales bacterium]|nr:MAG: pyruvate dehydrogenase (acetyl-transferring) E1 component subunit alpha [Rhodothermaeota bacterium MED-G19]